MELNEKQQEEINKEIHRLKLAIAIDKDIYRERQHEGATVNELVNLCHEIVEYQNQLHLLRLGRLKELPYCYKILFST